MDTANVKLERDGKSNESGKKPHWQMMVKYRGYTMNQDDRYIRCDME